LLRPHAHSRNDSKSQLGRSTGHRNGRALVRDRSREFIEFFNCSIRLIRPAPHQIDPRQSLRAHLPGSQSLACSRPPGRFESTFTPKHGSWFNIIEGFFSKVRPLYPASHPGAPQHELKERIMAGIDDVNRHPVIHTWSYKLAEAA
jgi:hypothetical protein